MKKPLVVGSLAFDLIFGIHGKIQDEILVNKDGTLGRQNLMFTAKPRSPEQLLLARSKSLRDLSGRSKTCTGGHFWGGTGANIAYGLGLLGKKPLLFSLAGKDFDGSGFGPHLKKAGVDSRVVINDKNWTAVFYGMSDELGQQIGVYQPNAYEKIHTIPLSKTLTQKDFSQIGVAIFSAGTGTSIYRHMKELRERCGKKVTVIFDPGQVISIFYDKKLLEKTLAFADIFIGNEVECRQLQTLRGYTHDKLLAKGLRAVIETRGANGSILYEFSSAANNADRHYLQRRTVTRIPAIKAKKIVEATGAGDAYRAGIMAKLLEGRTIKEACEFGAQIAARSVAFRGGQTYTI